MDNTFLREAIEKIEELTDSAREPHVVEIAGKKSRRIIPRRYKSKWF